MQPTLAHLRTRHVLCVAHQTCCAPASRRAVAAPLAALKWIACTPGQRCGTSCARPVVHAHATHRTVPSKYGSHELATLAQVARS